MTSATQLRELVAVAEAAATVGAEVVRESSKRPFGSFETKTSPTDPVTSTDRAAEAAIALRIMELRPSDSLMGEEETSLVGSSQVTWVVDPLDGTVNFLYRRTDFAVSVAAEINGVPVAGAVFDVPRNLLYSAGLGLGASRNGHPLLLAQGGAPPTSRLSTALLATGFGYDSAQRRRQAAVLAEILPLVRDIRRAGSAACDLCAVASGQADLYYEMGLKHWDYAAGALIAAEAGASVVGRDSLAPSSDLIVAGPTGLVDEFLEVLEPELEKWWPRP